MKLKALFLSNEQDSIHVFVATISDFSDSPIDAFANNSEEEINKHLRKDWQYNIQCHPTNAKELMQCNIVWTTITCNNIPHFEQSPNLKNKIPVICKAAIKSQSFICMILNILFYFYFYRCHLYGLHLNPRREGGRENAVEIRKILAWACTRYKTKVKHPQI